MPRRALAFLANDRYYDWTVLFLESVRRNNATLPLYCVPFDDRHRRVRDLRHAFDFEMLKVERSPFDALVDEIRGPRPLYESLPAHGIFRRFLALDLDYDEIAYLDVDTALLVDPDRLFGHVSAGRADLVYLANTSEGVYRRDRMDLARQHFPNMQLFSSGGFITSPKTLSVALLINTVRENEALYRELMPVNMPAADQTVLNFVMDCTGKVCRHISECDKTLTGMGWYRNPDMVMSDGVLVERQSGLPVTAVHWAGGKKLLGEWTTPRLWPIGRLRRDLIRSGKRRVAAKRASRSEART